MEERCIALKLLLDSLGVSSMIESVEDRKRVQKSVYLIQLAGIELGYHYSWYRMGPYSPALTRDYYQLAEGLAEGDEAYRKVALHRGVTSQLNRVRPLMSPPPAVPLDQAAWLELVASLHYFEKVNGLTPTETDRALEKAKPNLSDWIPFARSGLKGCALLT